MNNSRQRKAFTIVEMVIVIAVIAILAAVLIPTISVVIEKANISADQQFAASLNVQLAMWEVDNGTIDSESDLRDAINHYYGEWEDEEKTVLKADGDFYATLEPKSGKYGYHYWYDAENRQVVLNTYDKLAATVSDGGKVDAAGEGEGKKPKEFSPESPRSVAIKEKNYFLMDQAGSVIGDKLKALAAITTNADHATIVADIEAITDEADLAKAVADKLKTTAVANEHGVFLGEGFTKAEAIYIPFTVKSIGTSKVPASKFDIDEIHLPDSITKLGDASLLIGNISAGKTYNESVTIHWDVEATKEELGKMVSTNAFNCVLKLSDGSRWAFVNNVLTNLDTGDKVETQYSVELKQFSVSQTEASTNYDVHFFVTGSSANILHITGDTTEVKLTASGFIDKNGKPATRSVSWRYGDSSENGTSVVIDATKLKNDDIITVAAQNVSYEIKVVKVGIQNFEIKIDGDTGNPKDDGNGGTVYEKTLYYTSDKTWSITPVVSVFSGCGVNVSNNFVSNITAGNDKIEIDGNSLKLKSGVSGNFNAKITFTTVAKNADGNKLTITFDLSFEPASSSFVYADNANTYEKYKLVFTVGTANTINLGTLFTAAAGKTVNSDKITVLQMTSANSDGGNNILTKSGSDWKNWTVTPQVAANDDTVYISINDGGTPCVLEVKVISGAYNVASEAEWVSASAKICLLNNITLTASSNNVQKSVSYMNGNGNMIKAKTFVYTTGQGSLISISNGTIENVIINGPVYSDLVYSSNADTGMFTSGIVSSGTSYIKNSYVSGFKAPVRLNYNTLTITNSVIEGGTHANVYVYSAEKLVLDNSVTIQKQSGYTTTVGTTGKQVIGAGIFVDSKQTTAFAVEFKNGSYQYNWIDSSKTSGYYIGGTLFSIKDTVDAVKSNASSYVHNSNIANMGVFHDNDTSNVDVLTVTGNSAYSKASFSVGSCSKKYYDLVSIPTSSCNETNCKGHTDPTNIVIGNNTYVYSSFYTDINK